MNGGPDPTTATTTRARSSRIVEHARGKLQSTVALTGPGRTLQPGLVRLLSGPSTGVLALRSRLDFILVQQRLPGVVTLFIRVFGIIALIVSTGDVLQIVQRELAHGKRAHAKRLITRRKHLDQSLVRFLPRGLVRRITDQQFLDDLSGLVAEFFPETRSYRLTGQGAPGQVSAERRGSALAGATVARARQDGSQKGEISQRLDREDRQLLGNGRIALGGQYGVGQHRAVLGELFEELLAQPPVLE